MKNIFNFIQNLLPEPQEKSLVGIDLGSSSAKMVELKPINSGFKLVNAVVEPVLNGDKEKAIRSLLSRLKISSNTPNTAISGKGTLIRHIDVARMSLEELKKSFEYEADKYFPFPPDQIYTDCFILEPKGPDNKMSVLVAASRKELVDERIQMLTKLGLQAGFIGINSVAIANVFHVLGLKEEDVDSQQGKAQKPHATAILDMGDAVTNLNIMVGRLPLFTRDIFIGGRELTKNVSHAMDLSFDEAEKLKLNPGDKREEILAAVESSISNLVSELRLSFDYFVTEKNIPISRLLLSGGGTMLEGLVEHFNKYLEIPVAKWDPLDSIEIDPELPKEEIQAMSSRLGVAVGLAVYS